MIVAFMDGDIEIEPDKIYFDACTTSLYLIHQIAITIIENQRLNRMNYFKHNSYYTDLAKQIVLSDSSPRTLKEAIVENGFIKYRLKKRTEEDYGIYLDYLVSIIDYYPFYYSKPLVELSGLTINQLLRLYSELSGLISRLYFKGHFKYAGYDIQAYKRYFLPKIKHSVLKSYLLSVTRCSEKQIETFIKIITINNSTNPDLFCTQLINRDDYYFFPYYAITHPNYFCLIDYWLEQAGESLDHRICV
ncbi:MAG: hypothetical protein IPP79_14450 [Chitinophagaceae bacterium]|nr:hypothetical protein [Chitinophagaceae bacterium]